MKVHLSALGCRLNEAELQTWGQQFQARGIALTKQPEAAGAIVLNSCAVTKEAARKSRQSIRRLHRQNPQAKLFVTGCYASLESAEVRDILGVDDVIGNHEKDDLVARVASALTWPTMPAIAIEPEETALFQRHRDRAFVKVQDGCRYRCTYCIVTVARGEEKSRSIAELIAEINRHHEAGIQEIVLTGVHVGGYGSDIEKSLYDLVKAILAETDVPRIRFASVEPWDLEDDFFQLFENKRLMPHMHLPLQSGVNSVLRRMSRRCKTEDFAKLIADAKKSAPDFNVTTDIIVGFPGETEEEWAVTKAFVESMDFGHIHIFSYSRREGTKAARLPDQVNNEIKKLRSRELHEIAQASKLKVLREQLGKQVEVLWESDFDTLEDGQRQYWGHTPNFHRVSYVTASKQPFGGALCSADLLRVCEAGAFLEVDGVEMIRQRKDAAIPVTRIQS